MNVKIYSQADHIRELEKEVRKETKKISRELIDIMLHVVAWAIWDELKVTEDEIGNVLKKISYKSEFVLDGSVTLEDIKKMLKDEADITINISG